MGAHEHKQRALVIALIASLLLWNLPFGGVLLYPFKLLATWMHELSHGMVMLATGAGFERMEIYRDTSGLSIAERGVSQAARAAIAAAGYMGTPLFGVALLVLGQTRRGARAALAGLGAVMAVTAVIFVDGAFGITAAITGAAACGVLAAISARRVAILAVNFIAAQACINALLDIRVLFRQNLVVNGTVVGASDAHNMARATFGSPSVWATIWLVWSFALLYAALRLMYLRQQRAARSGATGRRARPRAAPPGGSDCSEPRRSPESAPGQRAPSA